MTSKLPDKVAVVTGGSAGIGLGIAKCFAVKARAGVYDRPPSIRTGQGSCLDRRPGDAKFSNDLPRSVRC
jgi:NAD(P)-dependent dehydrogenase (short-subunit alcohol dehydrogenase family)